MSVRLLFLGDILLNDSISEKCGEDRGWTPFGHVSFRRLIQQHDFSVASLDCVLEVPGEEQPNKIVVGTTESALERLALLNLGVVTIATNHVFDFGERGYKLTLAILDKLGIQVFGAGHNASEAARPTVIAGKDFRIGFLGYASSETTPILANPEC